MSLPKAGWIVDIVLIVFAVGLLLPVYLSNGQYARAHRAAGEAIREAQVRAWDDPEKYSRELKERMQNIGSPETYLRRREQVRNWIIGLFLVPLADGVACRRWAAVALVYVFWLLSWNFLAVRY
jgi:hypothetical protein